MCQTDGQTHRQTDKHHGNTATICSMNASCAKNCQQRHNCSSDIPYLVDTQEAGNNGKFHVD